MKNEIGGYFALECSGNPNPHENAFKVNSARNALRLVLQAYNVKKIWVPSYTCPVVFKALSEENCSYHTYTLDQDFLPTNDFEPDEYVIYTNYFGVCSKNVRKLVSKYPKLIIDNAQAFYMPHCGIASIYSPRKFCGVPDGGIFYCNGNVKLPSVRASSYELCSHLLKRWDLGATAGYQDFRENSKKLGEEKPLLMSGLSEALLGNVQWKKSKEIRLRNFYFLHEHLESINQLRIDLTVEDVPMVYPFLVEKDALKEQLINQKIYVATYWPGIEKNIFSNLLPLPIDQRYSIADMKRILEVIYEQG